jgi:hypothetical protein
MANALGGSGALEGRDLVGKVAVWAVWGEVVAGIVPFEGARGKGQVAVVRGGGGAVDHQRWKVVGAVAAAEFIHLADHAFPDVVCALVHVCNHGVVGPLNPELGTRALAQKADHRVVGEVV